MLRWPNSKHAGRTTDFAYVMDAVAACRRPFFPMSRSTFRVVVRFCFGNGDARPQPTFKSSFSMSSRWIFMAATIANNAGTREQQIKLIKECYFIKLIQSISACFMCLVDCAPKAPMTRYVLLFSMTPPHKIEIHMDSRPSRNECKHEVSWKWKTPENHTCAVHQRQGANAYSTK